MIKIEHLKKVYPNAAPITDITVEINKGEVVSIIGPSGSGKSTFLRCINMLEAPTEGKVIINGQDMTDGNTDICEIRKHIGMVFQDFNLFSHKLIVENVMMGPMDLLGVGKQEAFDEAVKLLKEVGLGEKLYAFPDELSGGQMQRAAIARCLAMKPAVLLLDEPTSALDPRMVSEVQAVIRKLSRQGLTMLIVSHDMKFSREIATRTFYLDEGTIYEEGTPQQIFDNPQKERTRAFINRLNSFNYCIESKDFDIYELNGQIEEFGRNQHMVTLQIHNIQLVIEELVINNIIKHMDNISIELRYYEAEKCTEMTLTYGGDGYNPFENDDEDVLSMLLVRQLTKNVKYSYSDKNELSFMIYVSGK